MRKRFRGNRPISTSQELEAGGDREKSVGMLYAGKGSYEGTGPKATSGKEELLATGEYEKFVRNDGIEDVRKK